jgi:ferredoxin-NADP reductase
MAKLILTHKKQEYKDVVTLTFSTKNKPNFQSGYYTHLFIPSLVWKFHKPGRELTFASPPNEEEIMFSINTKSNSLFQQAIKKLEIGDSVHIFRHQGHIVLPKNPSNIVMIAQGVGITPFRSMILDSLYRKLGNNITLIHVARNYLYEDELSKLPVIQYRVTREKLEQTITKVIQTNPDSICLVAGSKDFTTEIANFLMIQGVPNKQILKDTFKGLKH